MGELVVGVHDQPPRLPRPPTGRAPAAEPSITHTTNGLIQVQRTRGDWLIIAGSNSQYFRLQRWARSVTRLGLFGLFCGYRSSASLANRADPHPHTPAQHHNLPRFLPHLQPATKTLRFIPNLTTSAALVMKGYQIDRHLSSLSELGGCLKNDLPEPAPADDEILVEVQ